MTDKPAFTRREFVHTGLAIVSTVPTMPVFLQKSALAIADPADVPLTASRPGVPEDRILVVIQLSGGNDGLNTVVPYGMRQYYDARPMLAVRERDALAIARADGIGLHPRLAPLKEMMESGMANVVQGVGYPNPNRSHFASMDIYHRQGTQRAALELAKIAPHQFYDATKLGIQLLHKRTKGLTSTQLDAPCRITRPKSLADGQNDL